MPAASPAVPIEPSAIATAAEVIAPHVRRTPVIDMPAADLLDDPAWDGITLSLKLEHLQHSGSFKGRGAAHFMATQSIGEAGVVAASGGNHGAAVAWAASTFGQPANIFVPTIAAPAKVDLLRRLGATVHQTGAMFSEAHAASVEWQAEHGATAIHPYDDPVVMTGAGTVSREFERQVGLLDAVVVACGGGGLAGGAASWFGRRVDVVTCETEGTATYAGALAAGEPVDVAVEGLAADALGATRLGVNPWAALHRVGAASVLVTDDELASARRLLWERLRIAVEPSAATPIAAMRSGKWFPSTLLAKRVGVIVCGANTDPGTL